MRQLDNSHSTVGRRLLFLATLALATASCTHDDGPADADSMPVSLRAAIATATPAVTDAASNATTSPGIAPAGGKLNTRTALVLPDGTAWVENDRIGLFMLPKGEGKPSDAYPDAMNKQYRITDAATGALAPVDNVQLYFPKGEEVDFIAYYPFEEGQTTTITPNFGYQAAPATLDILYAKETGIAPTKAPVKLEFYHVLSRITLNITAGSGITADDIGAMVSNDVTTIIYERGHIDLSQGIYEKDGDEFISNVAFYRHTSSALGTHATFSVIVPPTSLRRARDYPLTLLVGGQAYRCILSLGKDKDYYPGNNYIFPITVNRSEATVAPPTIGEWNVVEAGETTAQRRPGLYTYIPPGTFKMGSPDTEQERKEYETLHHVTLTKGFYMSIYETTIAEYADFLNDKKVPGVAAGNDALYTMPEGSQLPLFEVDANGGGWTPVWNAETQRWEVSQGKENYPMGNVTWHGATLYAEWAGGALPTEAQWEYACRAGTQTAYFFGDDAGALGEYAVYRDNRPGYHPAPVGTKKPNPWGLYDMYGNVGEWCRDFWSGSDYSSHPVTDPLGPDRSEIPEYMNVIRGGSFYYEAHNCRSAFRGNLPSNQTDYLLGFRIIYPE